MRNYAGYNNNNKKNKTDRKKVKLVIEDNTIYEIDLDCCDCCRKNNMEKTDKEE